MTKKRGLGRGLGALIPPASSPKPASPEVQAMAIEIPIDQISANPHQPRQSMDQEKLQELANSITEHGLIQPLIVTQRSAGYQLIARRTTLAGQQTGWLDRSAGDYQRNQPPTDAGTGVG